VQRIVVLALAAVLAAVAASHVLSSAAHTVRGARTAAHLLRCDATALDRYDAADSTDLTDPTTPCAGIAKRLQAETGVGEAAVASAPPGH